MLKYSQRARGEAGAKNEGRLNMDISKVTVRELLANQKACDAMNAIDPKILKSPMVKLVKGKTVEAVFNMVPDSKVSPEIKQKIREALAAI